MQGRISNFIVFIVTIRPKHLIVMRGLVSKPKV